MSVHIICIIRLKSSVLQSFGFLARNILHPSTWHILSKFRSKTDEHCTVNWFVDNVLRSFSALGRLVLFHRRQSCRAGTCTLVLFAGGGLRTGTSRWADSFTLSAVTNKCVILSIKSSKVQRLSAVAASKPSPSKERRGEHEGKAQLASFSTTQVGTAPNAGSPSPTASLAEFTGVVPRQTRQT